VAWAQDRFAISTLCMTISLVDPKVAIALRRSNTVTEAASSDYLMVGYKDLVRSGRHDRHEA